MFGANLLNIQSLVNAKAENAQNPLFFFIHYYFKSKFIGNRIYLFKNSLGLLAPLRSGKHVVAYMLLQVIIRLPNS